MNIMHFIPHGFDLNLLIVFDALYRHKSVNKAAESIFISPSAFSHALNRLREVIGDPLFIRMKGEMIPTQKADELAPFIFNSLTMLSKQLFKPEIFDVATSDKTFTIATTDYTAFCVLPPMMQQLREIAPHIKIQIINENKALSFQNLALGKVDAVLGYSEQDEVQHSSVQVDECFSDRYVVIAPKGHYQSMALTEYIEAHHIRVSSWGEHNGIIDESLKAIQLDRKIALELPNMMIVPYILESTDLIITLPSKAVEKFKDLHQIDIFRLPLDIPDYKINLYTAANKQKDHSQSWLRHTILSFFNQS
jgi:DNA-binding transcriptional LysR family regulator